MQKLANTLNDKTVNPEKDYEILLEELQDIGLFFGGTEKGWYYDNE